jgi:hypothetical protein
MDERRRVMEPETIVIITGEHSSCLKETKFGGDPITECVSVHVGHPESVYVMNGRRTLYTESDMKAERQAGQNEAWDLARKIVSSPNNGGYTCPELKDIFGTGLVGNCFRDNTYQEAADKERKWKETANIRVGDVLVSTGNLKALVTYIGDDYMCLLFSDGSCGQIVKDDIKEFYKKTGQQFDVTTVIDLLKEEE